MFDLNEFYNKCASGDKVDANGILSYLKQFKCIIIRGAAGQGVAVGRKLKKEGVNVTVYWDQRFEELKNIDGIPVEKPFSKEFDRSSTLIIYCIPNHVIMGGLIKEINDNGYTNILRGDILYSGIICGFKNGDCLTADRCWGSGECRSVVCKKAESIIKNQCTEEKPGERIDLTYCCFIINSICNLDCTHCVQFINNYPIKARGNVPIEIICQDIDSFLDIVDSVGTISVMGGETFMHPDIAKIAKKFSEKKNFGFVSFPTNGLFPIKPEQLEGIDDPRIVIAFGYYLHVADEKQKEIYRKNVELVKSYGITYTESLQLPTWIEPSGMTKLDVDEKYMTDKKQSCLMPPRNLQVKNGKVHTCDRGVALYNMGVVDYPTDYYELNNSDSLEEERRKFMEFVDRPFYNTCGHCGESKGIVPSGMQGRKDVF